MSADDALLASNIKTVLGDEHTKKIDFEAKSIKIKPEHFGIVSKYVSDGKIKVKVEAAKSGGRAAEYDSGSNTIYGKETSLEYIDQKSTLVHECLHAYLDILGGQEKGFSVTNQVNETIGYLVAQIYRYSNFPKEMVFGDSDPNVVAYNVVQKKCEKKPIAQATLPLSFSEAEIKPLMDCIAAHPEYKKTATQKSKTDGVN